MTDYVHIDITELVEPPSMEEEFTMERKILELQECNDIEELKKQTASLLRENLHQLHFVSRCLDQIAVLQSQLICAKNPVRQPKSWGKEAILRRL